MTTQNLVELWEEHCRYEFESRDVNATMATMVKQPYVNHIPTMTGGVGHEQLKRFYAYHFIPVNPSDFRLTLISRTVGTDTLVDEFILKFTHDTEIDWMLPGIPPTGCKVEVPMVAIIKFEEGKLVREHIYWDRGHGAGSNWFARFTKPAYRGGRTQLGKVEDKRLPSNTLMKRWSESGKVKPL